MVCEETRSKGKHKEQHPTISRNNEPQSSMVNINRGTHTNAHTHTHTYTRYVPVNICTCLGTDV